MEGALSLWRRVRAQDPFIKDIALALFLLGLAVGELSLPNDLLGLEPPPPPAWPVLAIAVIAPLVWRRRFPLVVVGVQAAAGVPIVVLSGHLEFSGTLYASVLIGAYSAGAYGKRRVWSLVVIVVGAVVASALLGFTRFMNGVPGLNASIPLTAWLIGHSIRGHRRQVADLEERALRVELERDARMSAAVAQERARIARELHDVVAHGVAVMVVQAEAARRLLRRHPEQAEGALRTVSATGSEALTELQHLLGVLGDGERGPALEPTPGLGDLDTLVGRVQAAGLLVELHLEGDVRSLPRGLDLTAYRIVQEALTNVLKHAGTGRADVRLRYTDDWLGIEVTDTGRAAAPPSNGTGRGLVGMRERVSAYGGELQAGPRSEGGFGVRVRLPLEVAG